MKRSRGRPPLNPHDHTKSVLITAPSWLIEQVDNLASVRGESRSELTRGAWVAFIRATNDEIEIPRSRQRPEGESVKSRSVQGKVKITGATPVKGGDRILDLEFIPGVDEVFLHVHPPNKPNAGYEIVIDLETFKAGLQAAGLLQETASLQWCREEF